jgi:hypothetical protein
MNFLVGTAATMAGASILKQLTGPSARRLLPVRLVRPIRTLSPIRTRRRLILKAMARISSMGTDRTRINDAL